MAAHSRGITTAILAASTSLVLLSGCSGSGSAGGAVSTPQTLSGTAAVGAPMLDGTVTVKDSGGITRSASIAPDGSYSALSVVGMTPPFRIQACGLIDGSYACYYAVAAQAGTANVTPLTDASVSLALGHDAATMFDPASDAAAPPDGSLAAQQAQLLGALGPVLSAIGLPGDLDFTSTSFIADHTGMDKLLDAVKLTTITDLDGSSQPTSFVQLEGKIDSGSVLIGGGSSAGTLSGGSALDIDLSGISTVFASMSATVGAASETACATQMSGAGIFDPAFSMNIDGNLPLDAGSAPTGLCHLIAQGGMLGGAIANPALKDCNPVGGDSVCSVAFDIVKGSAVFDGAEMAVVQHPGSPAWRLLGQDSIYQIHVNAAVQRSLRVDIASPTPEYTRAISFDIGTGGGTVHAAKVYQHDLAGTGWDATPIATLDDSGCPGTPRLTIQHSSCGSSWLSLDSYGSSNLADGDALIDAFYKRGRKVRIDLFSDVAGTALVITLYKRVDGVPPKAAALATVPWLELDATTRSALVAYDGTSASFTASWLPNGIVSAKDITFCLAGDCSGAADAAHDDLSGVLGAPPSDTMSLSAVPASAAAYKQISLYGRDRDQMGVSSNYRSCGGAVNCP